MSSIRRRVAAGETLYGCFVMIPSPAVVEMVAHAGFDFAVLDREHGAASVETLEHQIRAADAAGLATVVRVPSGAPADIQHALDAGATGILVPHVLDADQARDIVRAAYYPPLGTRGLATTTRAGRHGLVDLDDHLARAREETLVMLQIEDAAALEHVRAIASVEGVGAIFIGPSDLSASLGHPGRADHPEVRAAIARIIEDVRASGGPVLSSFARDAQATGLKAQGIGLICLSTTALFVASLRQALGSLRAP